MWCSYHLCGQPRKERTKENSSRPAADHSISNSLVDTVPRRFLAFWPNTMELLEVSLPFSFVILPIIFVVYEALWIIYCRAFHPLASIPSDLWPSISRTWIMYQMHSGSLEEGVRKLHAKYGAVVRVAPNEVSASEACAIAKVYSSQKPLLKSDFYPTYRPIGISKKADLFTNTDELDHARLRRIVSPVYTMASIQKSEKAIDGCLEWLVKRLDEFAKREEVVDLGHWIEMCATPSVEVVWVANTRPGTPMMLSVLCTLENLLVC